MKEERLYGYKRPKANSSYRRKGAQCVYRGTYIDPTVASLILEIKPRKNGEWECPGNTPWLQDYIQIKEKEWGTWLTFWHISKVILFWVKVANSQLTFPLIAKPLNYHCQVLSLTNEINKSQQNVQLHNFPVSGG